VVPGDNRHRWNQQGTTGNIITDAVAAQHTILSHQDVIVVESISSFYLAAVLIVFGAALRPVLGEGVPGFAAFGEGRAPMVRDRHDRARRPRLSWVLAPSSSGRWRRCGSPRPASW
jgi:hypothetical protein